MNNEIEMEVKKKNLSIKIPYEIKDEFKEAFPMAKWRSDLKRWSLPLNQENKFRVWQEEATSITESLEEIQQEEFDNEEILKIRLELSNAKRKLEDYKLSQKRYEDARDVLGQTILERNEVLNELQEQEVINKNLKNQAFDEFKKICDYEAILDAQREMKRYERKVGSIPRQKFHEAQEVIEKEHEKLEAMGLRSRGMLELLSANFNRPDKSYTSKVEDKDILNIFKIEQ